MELQETEVCVSLGDKLKGRFQQQRCFQGAASYIPCLCEHRVLLTMSWTLDAAVVSSASALVKKELLALFAQRTM